MFSGSWKESKEELIQITIDDPNINQQGELLATIIF